MAEMAKNGNECPVPSGVLMIIGGRENKGEEPEEQTKKEHFVKFDVLKSFVELIGKANPLLEIVTTASSEREQSYKEYRELFKELGIKKTAHIHHQSRKEVLQDGVADRI